ncbi:hypothetical protein [Corallococcus sp. RDP092CA]|uniref:hypothetical protein n=1 Tax=Corallococcus sp. RDP092CA TaxID=3109369 RepID=UPI0035B10474
MSATAPAPEISFQQFEIGPPDRRVMVWRTVNIDRAMRSIPILIAPGFGRKMSAFGPLAMYLAYSGFEVFRYDPLDHVGLSSGGMEDFTMSKGLACMQQVIDWMREERGLSGVGVVATSLSARIAYRLVARSSDVRFLVTAVGVTNLQYTLKQVFGVDYSTYAPEALPEFVTFEERHNVRAATFHADCVAHDWFAHATTVREVSSSATPIIAFIGSNDEWVREEDVRGALASGNGLRRLYNLTGSGHDLGNNPQVARYLFKEVARAADMVTEGKPEMTELELEPQFNVISEHSIRERRLYQAADAQAIGAAQLAAKAG